MTGARRLAVLRRVVLGEAGAAPALVLAAVAVVISFVVTFGPLALVSAGDRATRQAVERAPSFDVGALVSADYQAGTGFKTMTAASIDRLSAAFAAALPLRSLFRPGQAWGGVSVPSLTVLNAARSAIDQAPPIMEVGYRSGLPENATVVAGSLPGRPGAVTPGTRRRPGSITLTVAVTQATAARFSVRPGSRLDLGAASQHGPRIWLRVTGIIRPVHPASAFWQYEPALAAPGLEGPTDGAYWHGAAFTGPGDQAAMAAAYASDAERAAWFFPLITDLTTADVPRVEAAISAMASSPAARNAEVASGLGGLQQTTVSTGLADGLVTYTAQWQSTSGADTLLIVGLFAAGLVLLLVCCDLAAQAYAAELVLLRVRGGGLAQVAGRVLLRSCCVTLPALAAGVALAMAAAGGRGSRTALVLAGVTALAAIAGTPMICVLSHRKLRPAGGRRDDAASGGRGSARRLTAEVIVLLAAAAAIADLRVHGTGAPAGLPAPGVTGGSIPASTGAYLDVSAVLVAAAVGLLVNRAYRGPLRALARAASARRGPVGVVGLARAAASPASSVLPAMALMLGLTLAAFAVMVGASISAGQVAASWAQTGGDAVVSVAGSASAVSAGQSVLTAADLRAVGRVPGVRHVTAVYAVPGQGALAVTLQRGRSASGPLGIAVVSPAPYAALAADTPWPSFPAARLSRPAGAAGGRRPVPVLVSPGITVATRGPGGLRLEFGNIGLPVRVAGTITDTAAMPAGGAYVVLPQWAAPRLPSLPKPSTVLLTGPGLQVPALRSAVARLLPGSQVTIRRQVLNALRATPVLHMSAVLYAGGALAAAVLSALAVVFALATSTRSRGVLMTRLAALGMARQQALALGLTDAIPLLCLAAAGMVASSWLLAVVVGPILGLNVFTGSSVPVLLRPTWPALVVPLAGACALALAYLAADGIASWRRQVGAALRAEEAS